MSVAVVFYWPLFAMLPPLLLLSIILFIWVFSVCEIEWRFVFILIVGHNLWRVFYHENEHEAVELETPAYISRPAVRQRCVE